MTRPPVWLWRPAGALLLWILLLTACGDGAPTGPAAGTEATDLEAAIGDQVAAAADLGPGAHVGAVSGRVTIVSGSARVAQPAPVLLMTFEDFSEDGRVVLNGSVTYRIGTNGQAWIEGDLRVRLRLAVSTRESVRQIADGLRVRVELGGGADTGGDVQPTEPLGGADMSDCILLRGLSADGDAAAQVRARVARHLLAAAGLGSGAHDGPAGGTLTTRLQTEWIAGETGRAQVVTLRQALAAYGADGLVYDGTLTARVERTADGRHERYAGELAISGRVVGRVLLCDELGRALVAAALQADRAAAADGRSDGG